MNDLADSVIAALGSAIGYAVASVLQHRQARQAPAAATHGIRFLAYLVTQPAWLAGLFFAGVALILHALALAHGQLTIIQPVLLSGMLFALPASLLLDRRRPSLAEWSWALLLVAGITGFLLAAQPTADHIPTDTERLASLVGAGVVVAGALAGFGRGWRRHRADLYGLAAGVGYGITAALIKQVAAGIGHPLHLAASWFPYALFAVGVVALVLNQAAYRAGPLAASLPPMTMAEPVVAVIVGVLAFNEHLAHNGLAVPAEAVSAAAVALATVRLAQRGGGALAAGAGGEGVTRCGRWPAGERSRRR